MEDKGKISLELFAKIEHTGYEPLPHGLRNVISWATKRVHQHYTKSPPLEIEEAVQKRSL